MSISMSGHQCLFPSRLYVLWVQGWPVAGIVFAQVLCFEELTYN